MNILEKRDFIHSYLHFADEKTIDEFYEKLRKEENLRVKLESRAANAEDDIRSGRIFSRTEIEHRTANIGQ
jgi:hypothetical protein